MTRKKAVLSYGIPIFVIAVIAVLILGHHTSLHKGASLPKNIATQSSGSDNNANNNRKSSTAPAQTLNQGPTSSPPAPTSSSSAVVTITRAGVINSSLQVGTLLGGVTSGTCTLTVSQTGEQSITETDSVTLQNNSYVCPVFNVPLNKFPNNGLWNVSVSVSTSGSVTTGEWSNNPVSLSNNNL